MRMLWVPVAAFLLLGACSSRPQSCVTLEACCATLSAGADSCRSIAAMNNADACGGQMSTYVANGQCNGSSGNDAASADDSGAP